MRPGSHKKNTMTLNRAADTIALNTRLQIVRLDDFKFDTPNGRATVRGWGFLIPGMGFVKFKHDDDAIPYAPCGGRKALESLTGRGINRHRAHNIYNHAKFHQRITKNRKEIFRRNQ